MVKEEKFEYLVAVRKNERSETHEFGFHTREDRDGFVKDVKANGWEAVKTIDRDEEREL